MRRISFIILWAMMALGAGAQIEQEVTINYGEISLGGTVTLPASGDGPFPAVVMVSGSGIQDRDETILGHKPFKVIAEFLASCGIASLRYDDRGAGSSTALKGNETTMDFAADAAAAIQFLKGYDKINSEQVGYLGHSEGGSIAFINAAGCQQANQPAFVVTLAAPAVKGTKLMVQQNIDIAALQGI